MPPSATFLSSSARFFPAASPFKISDIVKNIPTIKKTDLSLKKLLCGIVGTPAAVAFFDAVSKDSLITPENILTDFDSCSNLLSKYNIQEYAGLNDNLCSYIDASLGDIDDKNPNVSIYAKNLEKYFKFLINKKTGNREAMAHFINNYESANYPNVNYLIALNPDTLEDTINKFLTSTNSI